MFCIEYFAGSGKCGAPANDPEKLYTPGARIVGGKMAQPNSWPWIAALIQQTAPNQWPYQFCGASLVRNVTLLHDLDSARHYLAINAVHTIWYCIIDYCS